MTRTGYFVRLALSVAIDLADFTLGRIPVAGSVGEGLASALLVGLWGPAGLLYLGELADPTDQLDGFLPTATIIALIVGWREGFLFNQRKPSGALTERKP